MKKNEEKQRYNNGLMWYKKAKMFTLGEFQKESRERQICLKNRMHYFPILKNKKN